MIAEIVATCGDVKLINAAINLCFEVETMFITFSHRFGASPRKIFRSFYHSTF